MSERGGVCYILPLFILELNMDYTKYHGLDLYLKNAPKQYEATPQQKKMKDVAEKCGVKKGMKKAELMMLMKDCIGPAMKNQGREE